MPKDVFYTNVEFYKRGLFDFISWIDYDTGLEFKFHEKQLKALELLNDGITSNVGYGGAARGGKSLLICADNLFSCYAYPGISNLVGRKKIQNLLDTTWTTMSQLYRSFGFKVGNGDGYDCNAPSTHNKNVVYKEVGSTTILKNLVYEPSDPEMGDFGSMEVYKVYVDQSEQIDLRVINKVSERKGTHRLCAEYGVQGKKLEVFNPAKGHETIRYWVPYRDGTEKPTRKFVRALPTDNPAAAAQKWVAEKEIEHTNGDMTEADYQKQIKGNFDYDNDPTALIGFGQILDLYTNSYIVADVTKKYITADIALKGSDLFVIGVWYGWVLVDYLEIEKTESDQVINIINALKNKHGIPNRNIAYDADGVGNYVGGFIKGANAFHNNATPFKPKNENGTVDKDAKPENYENLKTQCYYKFAERVNRDEVYLEVIYDEKIREKINEELGQVKSRDIEKGGKLKILRKDQVKQNIGRSPDRTDMLMMREFFELKPRVVYQGGYGYS